LSYMQTKSIPGPWAAGDRILVSISSHPMGERLVRAGRRLADDLKAEWYVVFVETPGHMHMPAQSQMRMQANLNLAEELGARVVKITGESVADSLIEFAHQHNITKIIAGKPVRPRWFEILRGTVIDQIIRKSGSIDVYVVSEGNETPQRAVGNILPDSITPHKPLGRYGTSLLLVLVMTLLGFPLRVFLEPVNLVMLYLVAVVFSAIYMGRGPSILASFMSVLAFDFFFVDPRLTFSVYDSQYILTFIGLLVVGLIISNSASLLRDQVDALRRKGQQSQALNILGRELTAAFTLDQVLEIIIRDVSDMFNRETIILLPEKGTLYVRAFKPGFVLSESEMAVADWAFKHGKEAGRGTTTLPDAIIRYIPLLTSQETIGVLGTKPQEPKEFLSSDQRQLMEGVVSLAAIAIERASFAEAAAQAETLRNTEKLQTALLNSISHELRTPLSTITGVLSSLKDSENALPANQFDPATRLELIQSASRQAIRLNHLVENLLDMSRLESGSLRLNYQMIDVQDLLGAVIHQMETDLCTHPLKIEIPPNLPLVRMDDVLIAQVLDNLLDNACKYSPPQSPVTITARVIDKQVEISITDHGIGIPEVDLERVFDKFFRVQRLEAITGTGLGLSICKGIIEAHGGQIWASSSADKGTTISFSMPLS
jgi:two-component system sensor histidine kinase KdpD